MSRQLYDATDVAYIKNLSFCWGILAGIGSTLIVLSFLYMWLESQGYLDQWLLP